MKSTRGTDMSSANSQSDAIFFKQKQTVRRVTEISLYYAGFCTVGYGALLV
jgi:hypothetical protein